MSNKDLSRKFFMVFKDRQAMGDLPRTHENCREKTGVARPGKTGQDNARRTRSK